MSHVVILCPMEFERRALLRALRSGPTLRGSWSIHRIGTGANCVSRAGQWIQADQKRRLILAGLAGGLTDVQHTGEAVWISEVRNERGETIALPHVPTAIERSAVVATTNAAIRTPSDRRTLAERSGASLVDQESVPVAQLAESLGVALSIVRGVSDDANAVLPASIDRWTSPAGTVRPGHVARAMLRGEVSIGSLRAMRRDATRALGQVATLIRAELGAATEADQKDKPATMG